MLMAFPLSEILRSRRHKNYIEKTSTLLNTARPTSSSMPENFPRGTKAKVTANPKGGSRNKKGRALQLGLILQPTASKAAGGSNRVLVTSLPTKLLHIWDNTVCGIYVYSEPFSNCPNPYDTDHIFTHTHRVLINIISVP